MQGENLSDIIELLQTLTIQQDELVQQNEDLRREVLELKGYITERLEPKTPPATSVPSGPSTSPSGSKPRAFRKGDRVIITNPRPSQDPKGEIIGFTITGHPKIRTSKETTRRAPHNLILDPSFHKEE